MANTASFTELTKTPLKDLVPFNACCCSITSLYLDFPKCIGCIDQSTILCFRSSWRECKPAGPDETNKYCICQEGGCFLVWPKTLIKGKNQFFCFENRCALPCDEEVPCLFTICFLTLFYNFKWQPEFLKSMSDIDPALAAIPTTPSPTTGPVIVQHIHVQQQPQQQPATATAVPYATGTPVLAAPSSSASAAPQSSAPPPPAPESSAPPPPPPSAPPAPAPPAPELQHQSAPPPPPLPPKEPQA